MSFLPNRKKTRKKREVTLKLIREQNLYQILKLSGKFIIDHNFNIESYSLKDATQDGNIISVGDNILFDCLRQYHGDKRTSKEIFDQVSLYRTALRRSKKEDKQREARALAGEIRRILFVKDVINVEYQSKGDHAKVAKNGFYVNGIKYIRFSAGAGQLRRQTVTFINENVFNEMTKRLMCGLDEKIKEINLAKLSAYFALSTSSILWVDTPRCCVVKDFNTIIKNQKVDWIYKDDDGEGRVEERVMDVELNSADGQGLIDPTWASHWASNMGLDYTPSSFVVRSCFVKGDLVPFDFKEYAKRNGITTIFDKYGKEYNINDIDVILSESQFKMHKYYSSWQEYLSYFNKYNLKWGVARYNKRSDPEYTPVNYQYIQVLSLTDQEINKLIEPTVEWLEQICSGDTLYAMLYCFGGFDATQNIEYKDIYSRAQNTAMKAVVKNPEFLKDSYVQRKIYRNIVEAINRCKIGKIWIRGNYQFCISDPIAQCRNALGLSPDGEIPADNVYCNFWNDRNVDGMVDICRSPMIDKHEHNPCALYRSDEADYWYQYIRSGCIFSIYDTSVCRMEDSDLTQWVRRSVTFGRNLVNREKRVCEKSR